MIFMSCFHFSIFFIVAVQCRNIADDIYELLPYNNRDGSKLNSKEVTLLLRKTCLRIAKEEDFQAFLTAKNKLDLCVTDVHTDLMMYPNRSDPQFYKNMCNIIPQGITRCSNAFVDTYSRCLSQEQGAEIRLPIKIIQSIFRGICAQGGNLMKSFNNKTTSSCLMVKRNILLHECFLLHDKNITQRSFQEQCNKMLDLQQCILHTFKTSRKAVLEYIEQTPTCYKDMCYYSPVEDPCSQNELDYSGEPAAAKLMESVIKIVKKDSPCKLNTRSSKLNAASSKYQWNLVRYILDEESFRTQPAEPVKLNDLVSIFNLLLRNKLFKL